MALKQQRPRRQKMDDRLVNPGASRKQIECDYGVAAFDRVATQMDLKWGIDRLPGLVGPELAAKYGAALAQLNEAIQAEDPELTAHKAQVCIKGMLALDKEATAAGHAPASGEFWEYDLGGFRIGILKDGAEWQTAQDARPDLKFFTLREAAVALKEHLQWKPIEAVKEHFPGANVVELRSQNQELLDDEIPF